MDRGAWWAAVHGVAQSRTRLKRLSMHACIGEGNGNPLQCSCLENLRDRGAWWAAVYGVTQSWTRLKRLSSSSSSSSSSSRRLKGLGSRRHGIISFLTISEYFLMALDHLDKHDKIYKIHFAILFTHWFRIP